MGEAGGGGGASQVVKDTNSSQNGSQDGGDVGNELAEEMEKLQVWQKVFPYPYLKFIINQNGSKESTPDVCPEYRGHSSVESSDESSHSEDCDSRTDNGGNIENADTNGVDNLERKLNQIESSTDTLVPENDAAVDKASLRNGVEVTISTLKVTFLPLTYLTGPTEEKISCSGSSSYF